MPYPGFGPRNLDYVLGIIKATRTRVGGGPFTTELFDDGAEIQMQGNEFGAVTGRPLSLWLVRCRSFVAQLTNSISGVQRPTRRTWF